MYGGGGSMKSKRNGRENVNSMESVMCSHLITLPNRVSVFVWSFHIDIDIDDDSENFNYFYQTFADFTTQFWLSKKQSLLFFAPYQLLLEKRGRDTIMWWQYFELILNK
ncbi:hypothetical protein DdX_07319 [Ditylenchus destructor]|uniref:Uncharacterized protein n=1 Tax=Ditylenchus destructor TaxID=166010 RepID=A0AAD4N664_9BILA|nr:hypothetical protein DdX_07319 [Ditylenchus destructor]